VILVEADFIEHIREKIIKSFMDILVLKELEKRSTASGYDVVVFIHKKFGIQVSSGTVYSALYSLERNGLIKGALSSRKRINKLTDKGEEALQAIQKARRELQRLTARIF
jgi:DNA-binding PadR family transcriptional regulator